MSSDAGASVSPIVMEVLPLEGPEPPAVVAGAAAAVVAPPAAVEAAVVLLAPGAVVATLEPLLSPPHAAATRASPRAATPTDCFHLMAFLRVRRWTGTGHGRRARTRRTSPPGWRARWPG